MDAIGRRGMRLLVTGGAGFIGSHLVERALERGDDVTVLDDLSTGRIQNLTRVRAHPRLVCQVGSITDVALVRSLIDRSDAVVHLAAAVGVRLILERPLRTIETNVTGTDVVLGAAARVGTPVLLASSSEVYGKGGVSPLREDGDLVLGATTCARWAYACSKALDEWLALAYRAERGLPVIVARLFNTVGPRQTGRWGMVLPTLALQALRNEPLTVFGTGEQSRCFAAVSDVVEVLLRLLATPAAVGDVFNVGSDHEITVNALARLVRAVADSTSPVVHVPYVEAYQPGFEDMARRVPDLGKLTRVVGPMPATPLEKIVADVVADQRERARSE